MFFMTLYIIINDLFILIRVCSEQNVLQKNAEMQKFTYFFRYFFCETLHIFATIYEAKITKTKQILLQEP